MHIHKKQILTRKKYNNIYISQKNNILSRGHEFFLNTERPTEFTAQFLH